MVSCRIGLVVALLWVVGCGKEKPLALGTLERDRIVHNATSAEIIMALPVVEGSTVKRGDLLVQLDDRRQQANLKLAEAQLIKAQARWSELNVGARQEDIDAARAELAGAQATLDAAKKTYARAQKLQGEKLTSEADYDQALANRDNAIARVRASEEKLLALTNGVRPEVLMQADADVKTALAQVQLATLSLQEMSIKATRDGYLDSLPWHLGERVNIGTPVAVVLAGSAPYGRVYIPETQRVMLQAGDALVIRLDGLDQAYSGRVRWVSAEPAFTPYFALNESDRARLMYLAEIDIEHAQQLPTGLPIQVYRSNP